MLRRSLGRLEPVDHLAWNLLQATTGIEWDHTTESVELPVDVFVSAQVVEGGEVLVVPVDALRRVVATYASLSDKILAAFMARRSGLLSGAASSIRVVGSRFSPETRQVREFLFRGRIPHEWLVRSGCPATAPATTSAGSSRTAPSSGSASPNWVGGSRFDGRYPDQVVGGVGVERHRECVETRQLGGDCLGAATRCVDDQGAQRVGDLYLGA